MAQKEKSGFWIFTTSLYACPAEKPLLKKDLNLQIHLYMAFFSDDHFWDSLHKYFLNQTTLDLRKEKWSFLNQEFTVYGENLLLNTHSGVLFVWFINASSKGSRLLEHSSRVGRVDFVSSSFLL